MRLANGILEQNGQIVDDSVATGDLLEELRRGADDHATEVLRGATGEEIREGGLLSARPSFELASAYYTFLTREKKKKKREAYTLTESMTMFFSTWH